MRRRQNSNSPMSLFPFLDTLVCTMGSLILMLLAMTPKIKERAEARELARLAALAPVVSAEPDPQPEPEPPPAAVAPAPTIDVAAINAAHDAERKRRRAAWFRSVEEARQALLKKQAELRQQRELLQQADAQIKTLGDQTLQARLKSEAAAEAAQSLAERQARLAEQEAQIAQAIASTRKNIDLANRQQATAKNEYSLVPYDGSSGTVRRPVYIECSGRGFRFLPEDETVSPIDLEDFRTNYNPLLTGTQSLVRFWTRRQRGAGRDEPEPYVLLLVRPSGAKHFYVARECLSSLGLNFGYELIEEDWKLSLPEADPVAKTVLKETLDLTIQSHRSSGDALADRQGGRSGFDDAKGDQSSGAYPSRASGSGTGGGPERGSPFQRGAPARGARDPSLEPGDDNLAGLLAGKSRSGSASGMGSRPGGVAGGGGRSGGGRPAGISGRGDDDSGPGAAGSGGGDYPSRAGSRGSAGGSPGDPNSDDALSPDGASGAGGRLEGGPGRQAAGNRSRRLGSGSARPATLGGSTADFGGDGPGGGDDLPPELTADYVPGRLHGPAGGAGAFGDPDGDPDGAADGTPQRSGLRGSRARKGQPASGNSPASDGSDSDAGSSFADSGKSGATGGGQSPGQVQMGGPGINVSLGGKKKRSSSKDDDPDDGPRISEDSGKSGGSPGRASGPRKWGQAHRKASIGFEKKVVIRVSANRIVIGNNDAVIGVSRSDTSDEIVHQVVAGIDHTANGWGEPPSNFYWVPVAKFIVAPGGAANYEKLHAVLDQKWGITSTVDYESETSGGKASGGGRP
jgi:hypothetical protein